MPPSPRIVLVSAEAPMRSADNAGAGYLTALIQTLHDGGAEITLVMPDTAAGRQARAEFPEVSFLLIATSAPGGQATRVVESVLRRLLPIRPPRGFVSNMGRRRDVMDALRTADVIDAQWPTMTAIAGKLRRLAPDARIITTLHDVASQGLIRQLRRASSLRRSVRFAIAAAHARQVERQVISHSDTVVVFSEKDRALLPDDRMVHTVYPPLEVSSHGHGRTSETPPSPTLLFVGPLYRGENREGLRWFTDEVWPLILERVPAARLLVAGRATSEHEALFSHVKGLEFLGFVDDLDPYYAETSATIAPLWVGAGVKFKVVDAMVRGVPVVGTSVALEGIGEDGIAPTPSDTANDFAYDAVVALTDPAGARHAAGQLQEWALSRYGAAAFKRQVSGIYGLGASTDPPTPLGNLVASVVLPVLNGEHEIARQLSALARQDIASQLDVIIADNGSTDGTARVVRAFHGDFGQLRVVDAGSRRGANHARNVGLMAAACEKVLFCDHDDAVHAGWATNLSDALERSDVVGGRLTPVTGAGEPQTQVYETDGLPTVFGYLPYALAGNMAVRRSAALSIRGFDESFAGGHEEVDFCWRAQHAGYTIDYESDAEISYYQRSSLRGRLKQSSRAARTSILLWARHHDRGHLRPISFRGSVRGLVTSPRYIPGLFSRRTRDESARALGWVWGTFSGHLKYRLLGLVPDARLMRS